MDKPKCKLCGERHYGLCEGVTPSRGDPRYEAHDVAPPPSVPRIKPNFKITERYAMAHTPEFAKAVTRLPPTEKTVLDRALTPEHIPSKSVTNNPPGVTKKRGRPKKDKVLSTAERVRAHRARAKKLAK